MGFGRKIDPEPGRCRRTDGKKWRCSKEAYPDSKYCERHMHRGRNRSRKPVEASSSSSTTNTTPNSDTIPTPPDYNPASIHKNLSKTSPSMFTSSISNETPQTQHQSSSLYPFLSRPQGSNTNPQLFLNSGSYVNEADHRDYRFVICIDRIKSPDLPSCVFCHKDLFFFSLQIGIFKEQRKVWIMS